MYKVFILSLASVLAVRALGSDMSCRDISYKILKEGTYAKLLHDRGVRALAVPIPIAQLPALMRGVPLKNLRAGSYNAPNGVLTFDPMFASNSGQSRNNYLSERKREDPSRPQPIESSALQFREDDAPTELQFTGDKEHVVLMLPVSKIERMNWRLKPRTQIANMLKSKETEKVEIEEGDEWKALPPSREVEDLKVPRDAKQRTTDLEVWTGSGSDLEPGDYNGAPMVLYTQDNFTIRDVSNIWVHPDAQLRFNTLWREGYARSELFDLDYELLKRRVLFQETQP